MFRSVGVSACIYLRSNMFGESVRYRQARKAVKRRRLPNPGVQRQAKLVNENQNAELEESDFEELEADFVNVHLSHRQHEEQLDALKEQEKHFIVRQKYFKEKTPNFLTWSDKQQIQYLHNTNPQEWTIEKLSEGFPALPHIVAKIVKASWTKSATKIENHDASVKSNWNLFKAGKMTDLPPALTEHLNKFTTRQLNFEPFQVHEEKPLASENKLVEGEFSEIISSYKRIKEKSNLNEQEEVNTKNMTPALRRPKKEMYVTVAPEHYKQKREITLSHLRHKLEAQVDVGKDINEEDKLMLKQLQETRERAPAKLENSIVDITQRKFATTGQLSNYVQTKKDYSHLKYPENIIVPRDKFKRGCTYKLNDCFYDCDGSFLYRVPGMDK